jgi:hypothetical protein
MMTVPTLTVWQPWASLMIEEIKPYEFRDWTFLDPRPGIRPTVGQRIVIHAAKRPMRPAEIRAALDRLYDGHADGMRAGAAIDLLEAVWRRERTLPHAAALGSVELGQPVRCTALFPDDDGVAPNKWAWPLQAVRRWLHPHPISGAQGFWPWPHPLEAGQ